MPTVIQSIGLYLAAQARRYPQAADLLGRWSPCMETQVNVIKGDRVDGLKSTYTDGINTWWDIRVPKGANGDAHFHDYEMRWPLDDYAEAIGSTGWDWVHRHSRYVGFDFDTIAEHAAGVGIEDAELDKIKSAVATLPYVERRFSTGGKGLHLYVLVDRPSANHTEHARFARRVLKKISNDVGFDLTPHVDACGGNLWLWHRKLERCPNGLTLIEDAPCQSS